MRERADWGHNDVLNGQWPTQEVNWHRHMTWVDLAIDYYNTNLESGTASNKAHVTKEIEVCGIAQ